MAGALVLATLAAWLQPRGVAAGAVYHGRTRTLLVLTGAGVAGMLADSVLGATVQGKYECPACDARFERGNTVCHEAVRLTRGWRWLDNDAVNLAATLVGAAVAGLETARSGEDYVQIRDAIEVLSRTTEPFARRVMDESLREALANRRLEEL